MTNTKIFHQVHHICEKCGVEFMGKAHQIYCSPECYRAARSKKDAIPCNNYTIMRRERYERLIRYVVKNNLKEILKKYLPGKVA